MPIPAHEQAQPWHAAGSTHRSPPQGPGGAIVRTSMPNPAHGLCLIDLCSQRPMRLSLARRSKVTAKENHSLHFASVPGHLSAFDAPPPSHQHEPTARSRLSDQAWRPSSAIHIPLQKIRLSRCHARLGRRSRCSFWKAPHSQTFELMKATSPHFGHTFVNSLAPPLAGHQAY